MYHVTIQVIQLEEQLSQLTSALNSQQEACQQAVREQENISQQLQSSRDSEQSLVSCHSCYIIIPQCIVDDSDSLAKFTLGAQNAKYKATAKNKCTT